jgi:hypothetical protein
MPLENGSGYRRGSRLVELPRLVKTLRPADGRAVDVRPPSPFITQRYRPYPETCYEKIKALCGRRKTIPALARKPPGHLSGIELLALLLCKNTHHAPGTVC